MAGTDIGFLNYLEGLDSQ